MRRWTNLVAAALGVLCLVVLTPRARADEIPAEYKPVVEKGLQWLVKQQHKDGHWDAAGGQFATAMTGIAGVALLMEGSTIKEGKYSENIRKATEYLLSQVQPTGLIGQINAPNQGLGYLYGHGFSMLFLSQIYGGEEDAEQRRRLETVLTKAVDFCIKSQTNRGGWGYVSARDGNDFDEGSVSVTQVQALRACRNAGIPVPKETINKVHEYLRKCTKKSGGMIYSLASDPSASGPERPTITVAAIASMFSTGEYKSDLAVAWLKFAKPTVPIDTVGRDQFGHSEYTHYYYAQVIYILGEDGYAKMFPSSAPNDRLTWSGYKKGFYPFLKRTQKEDGHWDGAGIGPVYTTCCYLTVLQLDSGTLPIYQR